MKISSSANIPDKEPLQNQIEARAVEKKGKKQPSVSESRPEAGGDRIDISDRAREFERVSQIVRQTPDARMEKVESLKKAIESGTYHAASEQVADKILEETGREFLQP